MSYSTSESSKFSGAPIELFRYRGTYESFYYTSGQVAIDFQADDDDEEHTYVPIATRRSAVNQTTQNDDNAEVTIELPVDSNLVAIYGFQISPPDLELTIFRGHAPGQYIQYWSGNVENIQVANGTATIRVPSRLASALSADFPNVYYQSPCNHTLGDARCGIDLSLWSVTTTIGAVSGRQLTVASIGAYNGQLLGGDALLPSGERRMIVAQDGNVLTLNYPFANADIGSEVILAVGCDLSWKGDCKTKFNNTERFGGFPLMPIRNPFSGGLEPGKNLASEPCLPSFGAPQIFWSIIIQVDATQLEGTVPSLNVFGPPSNQAIQPNPGGRIIRETTSSYAGLDAFLNDIYEIDEGDPCGALAGQPLEIGTMINNLHFRRDFYYPFKPTGNWRVQFQTQILHLMTPNPAQINITIYDATQSGEVARLWPYDFFLTTT